MLTPSPEAQTLLMVFSGEKWPSINEDLLREAADHYEALVGNFEELQTYLVGATNYIKENFSGKAAEEFVKYADYLASGGEKSILNGCADQAENLAAIARDTATQAEYSKWMILGQVIQLMAELAFLAAVWWIPGVNAAAEASAAAAELALKIVAQAVIKALVKSILTHTAISVAMGAAMDVIVQLIQMKQGNRGAWDWDATKSALGFGAVQGVFGGVFSLAGGALGKQIAKVVGSDAAKWLGTQIGNHLDTLADKTGANKGLAHALGNLLGGADGELAKGLNKSTGKLVSDSFVDKVGNAFAKHGFNGLSGDAARNVGKTWASSLNKHWSTAVSVDQVSEKIAKDLAKGIGGQVDAAALKTLSHAITGDVAKSLSSKTMSETLTKTQKFGYAAGLYGTSALVDAGAQNLAEGTYNLMTQGKFTTTWQTFVSGVVPTAFGHAIRHTIVHPLLAQSNSLLANFLKDVNFKLDTLDKVPGEYGPQVTPNDSSVPLGRDMGATATATGEPTGETGTEPEPETEAGTGTTAPTATTTSTVSPAPSPVVTQSQTTPQAQPQVTPQAQSQTTSQTQTQTQSTSRTPAPSGSGNGSGTPPVQRFFTPRPTESNSPFSGPSRGMPHFSAPSPMGPPAHQDFGTPTGPVITTTTSSPTPTVTPVSTSAPISTSEFVTETTSHDIELTQLGDPTPTGTTDTTENNTEGVTENNTGDADENNTDNADENTGGTGPNTTTTTSNETTETSVPHFLKDVSTYLQDTENKPLFSGAVGGHLAVRLDHDSKDPAQLADELVKKAGVTLHEPEALALALAQQPHTFLGDGRRFAVTTTDGRTQELRIKAVPEQDTWKTVPADEDAPTTPFKLDTVQRSQQTEGLSHAESSNFRAPVSAAVVGAGVVGRITVAPGMATGRDHNLNTQLLSQRETRSHGASVELSTDVRYELTLRDKPATESAGSPAAPTHTHTVTNGLTVRVPESHTTNTRPDPRKDRVPLKFTTESGERAGIEHTESYFNLDAVTDWVLQHTDSPVGSSNYKAVVNHFTAEHFTQMDGRSPVPPLRLHTSDGSASGTVTIDRPVPRRHWVIDAGTDFELRDTGQFTQKNESSVHRDHSLDTTLFVGAQADPTGFSDAFAAPRVQAGLTFGYSHSSRNTANLGGPAAVKHAERSPKDVRTVLVLRESTVTVRAPDGTHETFTVGSLVRMPVGEARRLAGWDNQDGLRVDVNPPKKPAYWGDEQVSVLGPGRLGEIRVDTPPRNPEAAANDRRTSEERLFDALFDKLKKADPGLPLATRDEVEAAGQHRSWFKRLFRRGRTSALAVENARGLMAALSEQELREGMHQAATAEGIRVPLAGSTFVKNRGYTLTIRADLDNPTYTGSARRTPTEATGGGERFDTAQQVTHSWNLGLEATFSARQNAKDELGTPLAVGTGGIGARGGGTTTRQVKSGGTATREDLFVPGPGTDYYDFTGSLTFEIERSAFPQPLMQALTLGGMRALAQYGEDSHVRAVKWLYEHAGLGGIGEARNGKKSVTLASHPVAFSFGVPDALSRTSGMSDDNRDRFTGKAESSRSSDAEVPDEILAKGLAAITLSTRADRNLLGSVLDLVGKNSGNAWQLTDAGAVMSERIRRIFGQHSLTSLSDQVFSPGGHIVGNLHDKGTFFAGDESVSLTGTRHNLTVVGTSFTASPEMNTALEQAFGHSRGKAWGGSLGTTGMFAGVETAGATHLTGQGGTFSTWLQKFRSSTKGAAVTSTRDLNQVMDNDRWVLVVGDTDYRIDARHKPLGFFGRPFGNHRTGPSQVIRKPGGWVGLIRERDAIRTGLIDDGLGPMPKTAADTSTGTPAGTGTGTPLDTGVETPVHTGADTDTDAPATVGTKWRHRSDLDGASRGAFAHNAPQDAAGLKKLGEALDEAGIAEQTRHTINAMVSARSGRSAIQSGGPLTARGRTSALAHVRKLNVLGKDVAITVRHERVGTPEIIDTLFGDHEFGANRGTAQDDSVSSSKTVAHGVTGGELVRVPGGSGGPTAGGGAGAGDSVAAVESVSGVTTQVTTLPGPKAVLETRWRTTVTVTYSDGGNAIEPVTWDATVTTSESYLMLEPVGDEEGPSTPPPGSSSTTPPATPPSLRPKAEVTIDPPKSGGNPADLLTETTKKNDEKARKGDGGLHIHEVIGADQVQKLGKLLVSRAHRNDLGHTAQHTYEGDRLTEAVNHATRRSSLVKPGSSGADALDTALNDPSLTAALSSGVAQSGQHAVTVFDNSLVGGVDATLTLATHLDFKNARRIAVSGQVRLDDLTGTGTGDEMSDGTALTWTAGPGAAGSAAIGNSPIVAPGISGAGVGNSAGETHRIGQAEQSRLNLKPPAGHGHLYAVPATFHLAAETNRHIKDGAVGRPFTSPAALQSGKTEATVLVWLSDQRVKELELDRLARAEAEATDEATRTELKQLIETENRAAQKVTEAEKAWADSDKKYWEERRKLREELDSIEEYREKHRQLEEEHAAIERDLRSDPGEREFHQARLDESTAKLDGLTTKLAELTAPQDELTVPLKELAEQVEKARAEYFEIRELTDPIFRDGADARAAAEKFREKYGQEDEPDPEPEDEKKEFSENEGENGTPATITIDGTTYPLVEVENEGHGFFNALAMGLDPAGSNGPELWKELVDELKKGDKAPRRFVELAGMVPPDLADAFTGEDVTEAGLLPFLAPTTMAGREFQDRDGALPPMKEALTEQQRHALAELSANRTGNRATLTDHGTADLYPALAAALWKVPVTVAYEGKLHTFTPGGGEAKPGDRERGVLLHLKDDPEGRTYRYVDQSSAQSETPKRSGTPTPTQEETPTSTQEEAPNPAPTEPPAQHAPSSSSPVVRDDEGSTGDTGGSTLSQDIFEVLSTPLTVDDGLAELGQRLRLPVMGLVALDQNLAGLGINRSQWYALDGHLARNGSALADLAGSGDPARIRRAVVDWLAAPLHQPSSAVVNAAQQYGITPDHLERLLRENDLHRADGLVDFIEHSRWRGPVTEWFTAHPESVTFLRDQQDAIRLAAVANRLGITVEGANGPRAREARAQHLTAFRAWFTDNGGHAQLARTTDEQLHDAVARWNLEFRQELGNLPADVDVRALLRFGRAAEATGTTARFRQSVTHHLTEGGLTQTVALADALGHDAGLHEADALTRALGVEATTLRPFGKLLGHHLAQHAAAPRAIDETVASFRIDLAHHGFTTADLAALAAPGAGSRNADVIGTEQLDSFAHYLVNQKTLGATPHAAVRAWRNLPSAEAAAHVETWRGNDTAEGVVLGTVDVLPPSWKKYQRFGYLGPIKNRAFRAQRVQLPDGTIRADVTLPIKLLPRPGQEFLADAAGQAARTALDTYLNAPRYRLPNGDLLRVTVEFTDADVPIERWENGYLKSPSDGVHLVDLSFEPGGRMEARQWNLPGESLAVLAHELTHLLGPWDYYREHSNTLRPVYTDRALMGGPVIGDLYGQPANSPLSPATDRLHNQRLMPRDLNLIGSAIEAAWKDAGFESGSRNDVPSHLPLDVAERVLRGNPATGAVGLLAPVGASGRTRPDRLGDINPNGTYRAARGGPDNRPVMMFPEHWSLEEAAAAVEHVHREQRRRGNIGPDGEFEGVHHGVRIRGHALSDGTITDFEPSMRQDDLAPALFADPADEPRPTPLAEGGDPLATHRLWDSLGIGDRSHGDGGHVYTGDRQPAVRQLLFGTMAGNHTLRARVFALELQHWMNGAVRTPLTSPGPAVALSDGVAGLNTLFPAQWGNRTMDDFIREAHRQALRNGSFTLLPSGGYIWYATVGNVPMHGQVLDGEHQRVQPSWHQSGRGDHTSTAVLAEAHDIEFHTGDGAHYRMNRELRHNGEQTTEIVRVLHVPRDSGMDFLLEPILGARLFLGDFPGLGQVELRVAIEYDGTADGPDTEPLNRASRGVKDLHTLLGTDYTALRLSAPRTLEPDRWRPPAGTPATPVWHAAASAVLDLHGTSPLTHEPGIDALVLHTAQKLASHADRERTEQDLVGATGRLYHPGAGSNLTIPENLRGDWTPDRVRLAALQHSLHARPVEGRQGLDGLVLEAFPTPGVRLEIRHERGPDGTWLIADYAIHTDDGPGTPPLWQPDGPLAEAAADMGVDPAHLFVLSQEMELHPQDVSSIAALLRGFGDPFVVLDQLDLITDRLGARDPLSLMRWMSAQGVGVEHWWDLAAHLHDRGETLDGLIEAGPDSDLFTSWDQRTQRPVRQDIIAQALVLGVHPRRLEMLMNATLIDDPTEFGENTRPLWEAGNTIEELAEQLAGQRWRGNFGQMAVQFNAAETAQDALAEFALWSGVPQQYAARGLPLDRLTLDQLTHAVALWRLGMDGPAATLPDGLDPRPLALLVHRLDMWPDHARAYIEGPGREAGPLPLTVQLEQRYEDARKTAETFADSATNTMPYITRVLEFADRLNIDPELLRVIPNLVVSDGRTVGTMLWHDDPYVSADLILRRLSGLGLEPRELAWFRNVEVTAEDIAHLAVTAKDIKNLTVTAEDITRFWKYVTDHHTTDEDLAALLAGNREAGPAAVRKWAEHEAAARRGPAPLPGQEPGRPGEELGTDE
ncbi:hypothetical protein ACFYW1_17730 [Streptomyces sp. NPDC002669]|uniref:WXG100-like domain-containing protein n=1 Tax=Streptomyces sp. NPDC002669 TaxID=3364658 RepID=UPI00368878FF